MIQLMKKIRADYSVIIDDIDEYIARTESEKINNATPTQLNILDYVDLSEGNTYEKIARMAEQVEKYKINIFAAPKQRYWVRCAIVNECREDGLGLWLKFRQFAEDYDEGEQTQKYLKQLKEDSPFNVGVLINRYREGIDNYNNNQFLNLN